MCVRDDLMTVGRRSSAYGIVLLLLIVALGCANASAQSQSASTAVIQPLNDKPSFEYFNGFVFDESISTPRQFLGYEIGERFTRHGDVMRYLETVATQSDRVIMGRYGATHEGRALHYLVISSPANLARLDEIKAHNRSLANVREAGAPNIAQIIDSNPAVVWFSYNVHGNEASCSESAMQLVYTLAAAKNEEIRRVLDNVVLVVDPMVNPDGRDRYVNWYNSVYGAGLGANANPDATEHDEPWPSGRTNHYHFDLNRDWLWLVHPESRHRIALYRTFLPQLHIDYHEQEHRSPYFFGAGDDPYNTNIPAETRRWIELYGEANARTFDARGLVYATKERFDYLYPGYGKVLPTYHGAIGLLCEQAGHGFAGLAVDVGDAYTLTLRTRAYHHFLTAMSYLETTAEHRRAQLERFRNFFVESAHLTDDGPMAFFVTPDNDPALLKKVWDLCAAHGIEVDMLVAEQAVAGLRPYRPDIDAPSQLPAGTWVIRADQAMGRLVRAVFERQSTVTEIDTYDITAWSLPVMWGLNAFFTNEPFRNGAVTTPMTSWTAPAATVTGEGSVALLVDSRQHYLPAAVGLAMKHGLFTRVAGGPIKTPDGAEFGAGSLIVHTVRNSADAVEAFIAGCAARGVRVHRASTGMVTEGHVLGANDNGLFETPRVLLVRNQPISGNSYGFTWHLLDMEQPIPYTAVNADQLRRINLDEYNVMVLAEMSGTFNEEATKAIDEWTRAGGVLVASGSAAHWASERVLKLSADAPSVVVDNKLNTLPYEERRQRGVDNRVPGALLAAHIDTTHPLAAGLGDWIGVLKRGSRPLPVADDGYVVARFADVAKRQTLRIGGTISNENVQKISGTPFVTHHRHGRGAVICFSDDMAFRGFHHAGMRFLMNAIVYGPSL